MVAGKRADGRENTHLDLGRLEGRDGAGERGGNAGHFCSCFFVLKKGECAGMARGIEDTPLYTAGIKIFWEDRGIGRWSGQFRVPGCRVKSPTLRPNAHTKSLLYLPTWIVFPQNRYSQSQS